MDSQMPLQRAIDRFFSSEASGGILLMLSAVAALIVANSALAPFYESWLNSYFSVKLNDEGIAKPLILWINDGLMAIFFFLIVCGCSRFRKVISGHFLGQVYRYRSCVRPRQMWL
ncbi:Na+/H+ antiporter NhaA [Nereida ignava]|nr:Na+/H+ antiporter NhaA [Nereida ignava]